MLNPPDIISLGREEAPIFLRTAKCGYRAVSIDFRISGIVKQEVPRSRICKL
jgi:hypothetical protein